MKSPEMINLAMTALDDLFTDARGREESRMPKIHNIPISEIDDFREHPFAVRDDEDMTILVESVRTHGIITPVTLRAKDNGRYEMISGHRRKRACELIGLDTIPAEIKNLSRDEATILMVESNFQRSKILPSEKAKSYKMWLDAIKQQGKRTDLTSDPVGGKSSAEVVGKYYGDSATQVRRYISLNNLVDDLLQKVDEGKIALRPAVELSHLKESEQVLLWEICKLDEATPSLAQALRIRDLSEKNLLDEEAILGIMSEQKPNQREKISLQTDRIKSYIPKGYTPKETEEYIVQALHHYHHYRQRQRQNDAR